MENIEDVTYKKKYLKYKKKYLNLKKRSTKNNFQALLVGGNPTNNFKVVRNSGGDGTHNPQGIRYANQCMWLSIIDHLRINSNIILTLDEIREIASSNGVRINGPQESFDSELHGHALRNVANLFELNIQIHNVLCYKNKTQKSRMINSDIPGLIFGNLYPNIVRIVSYGAHFELITEIDNIQFYITEGITRNKNKTFTPFDI